LKILTLQNINLREKTASRMARKKGVVFKDFEVEVARVVTGEAIEGNDVWYQDRNGDFLWSGGTTRVEDVTQQQVGPLVIDDHQLSPAQRMLGIPEIWKHATGKGVRVAVIDTGILSSHPDLSPPFVAGFNARQSNTDFADIDGHGTHCAGIIAARGLGEMIGVAPDCALYAVKMANRQTSGFSKEAFQAAIDWAIDQQVHVISLSLGTNEDADQTLRLSVEKAVNADIVVVAAIGNEGTDQQGPAPEHGDVPARYAACISVGALHDDLTLTAYTSKFDNITVCAPGNDVVSTWKDGRYHRETCTSMATPFVAGVVALLRSKRPDLPAADLHAILKNTALEKQDGPLRYRVIQPLAAFHEL